ncbi:hypothetical protein GM921_12575 [Pedobacter sp. LMG 31464]|uniref:Carbohydrate family 9 binding domain-like n=1 Tax=Pedobacter planticolens TaxID=2679964 RepID=A0A923E1G7_9SPHI|nr:DUF5916 domain-containing protein [Pedobacter planticolens]MBB2146328.1 hypothetical protein [Pedobacter planticolens]
MKLIFTCLILALCAPTSFAQSTPSKKKVQAKRTSVSPKIDGFLDDAVWDGVPIATDFVENRPVPGRVEPKEGRTEIKFLYDDYAIYVSARMYDKPDSVVHELVARDNIGNADFIGVVFDTFLDGQNGNGFFVTAAGVQFDAKYSLIGDEDPNWNAVWESAVKIDDKGWTAEMKIPYSALRFSSKDIQNWGMNVTRKRTGTNRQTFWNFVDPKVSGFINQSGVLEGLQGIKAPLRLSFSPYVSTLISNYPYNTPGIKNTQASINGGMDVKYGINQSFTLDMTLIPDFGQVQSDYRVLNLTPFEVKFNENRQFFTEGTELFNKGDLFYSKRIGSIPSYFDKSGLKSTDKVIKDPQEGKVLNATKISGRTSKGLGIGVFNAITNKMYTEVEDPTGNSSRFESQPLTNYNIFVLDQSLKNNSSVSVINTNVLRHGSAYDANVSAALFNINDKKNAYFINGAGKMSYLTADPIKENRNGYSYELQLGKKSGTYTFNYKQEFSDTKFDPSDMGFYTNNNFFNQSVNFAYNVYKPGKWYNQIQAWTEVEYSRRFKPGDYQSLGFFPGVYVQFKNQWSAELNANVLAKSNDFYESRNGQVYKAPASYRLGIYINPNRAKAYNFGGNITRTKVDLFDGVNYNFYFFQNFRVSDKLAFGLDLNFNPSYDFVSWVGFNGAQSVFSRYDRNTVENTMDAKYSFSNKMGIQLGVRHYWSDRRNKEFYALNTAGGLNAYTGPALQNVDRNYNVFNIDLAYVWQFTPGSELSITYKDAAETNDKFLTKRYGKNFDKVISGPQNNSLSIKVLYYIDYLGLVKKKSK